LAFLAAEFGTGGPDGTPEAAPTDEAEEAAKAAQAHRTGTRSDTFAGIAAKVERVRNLAEGLEAEAERKRGPRLCNTPKRQREAGSARVDGDRAARAASYLRAYANALGDGTVPTALLGWKAAKADALEISAQELGRERGYYDPPVETGEFRRKDPLAVALRALADRAKDPQAAKREAEAERESRRQAALVAFRRSCGPGFFPTPEPLAQEAARRLALCVPERPRILEPSAGLGALVDAFKSRQPSAYIHAIEARADCCSFLREWSRADDVTNRDFLEVLPGGLYDGIIMNPPFERLAGVGYQAPAHIRHALHWLKAGGTLVAIVPAGFLAGQGKEFSDLDATEEANDPAAFADRKEAIRTTGTRTAILTIRK